MNHYKKIGLASCPSKIPRKPFPMEPPKSPNNKQIFKQYSGKPKSPSKYAPISSHPVNRTEQKDKQRLTYRINSKKSLRIDPWEQRPQTKSHKKKWIY